MKVFDAKGEFERQKIPKCSSYSKAFFSTESWEEERRQAQAERGAASGRGWSMKLCERGLRPVGRGGRGLRPMGCGGRGLRPVGRGGRGLRPMGCGGRGLRPVGCGGRGDGSSVVEPEREPKLLAGAGAGI